MNKERVIDLLGLEPLEPEGGFFRQVYKSRLTHTESPKRFLKTAIYYLITEKSYSRLHRIKSDEIFHFYIGDPVETIQINKTSAVKKMILGTDLNAGQRPQLLVTANAWQGAKLVEGGAYALLGTTVSPGFEFEDFQMGSQEKLLNQYPQYRNEIIKFT
ncbi:MAG: cupin domain-containing protein [Desulfobacteraceae bacterium]|nr:cupin domain-containing protein [Desulfobacteraceae bacterium]